MEDFIGVIIWGIVIISWVARFIGKLSSKGKDNHKRKGLEKKIADFFSDNNQARQETTQSKGQSVKKTSQSLDDKWVPAYEESPGNDDRPLRQVANMDNSNNKIERPETRNKLNEKGQSSNSVEHKLGDESSIHSGSSIYTKNRKNSSDNNQKDRDDAYRQDKKRSKSYLDVNSFSSDDLIKGVIFKEILDQPRAKRPYKPFDGKR